MWHPSCYSCYKPGDKSWMRKGRYCDCDKRNIYLVICNTYSATGSQVAFLLAATLYQGHHYKNNNWNHWLCRKISFLIWGGHGHDHMVIGFTTTYAISAYFYKSCEFESCSWQGVLDTTLYNKVCQWLASCMWFSSSSPFSSTNKTNRHYIPDFFLWKTPQLYQLWTFH
jgi:hypothetical protein